MTDATRPSIRYSELAHLMSPARVERYLTSSIDSVTGRTNPARAVALYEHNIELSTAMWGTIAPIEVALRTIISDAIRELHTRTSPPRGSLWFDEPCWFTDGKWFSPQSLHTIRRAQARAHDPGPGAEGRPDEGRVIAELTLGFWRYLLVGRYEHSLWNPAIRRRFPALSHLSGTASRRAVHSRVERLNYLRNRIAHHEPVYETFSIPGQAIVAEPATVLREAIEVIEWSNPVAAAWITSISRFEAVASKRP